MTKVSAARSHYGAKIENRRSWFSFLFSKGREMVT